MSDCPCLAIEGPIGVGKTTLARMLAPEFGAELLLEIFEENPFLSDFYADRQRFAFQTQIFFLLSRYRQQREIGRIVQRQPLISDYIFAKDRLFAHLNLHGDELETYERLHSALAERIIVPDLVLYLRASPEVLMERIATRDRPYERSMSRSYIVELAKAYEEFFAAYRDTRLLVIDTDHLNVVGNPTDLRTVATQVREALTATAGPAAPAQHRPMPLHMPTQSEAVEDAVGSHGLGELYLEFLDLQRAMGSLAASLREVEGLDPAAIREAARRAGPPAQSGPAALGDAVASCLASLQRMASRLGMRAG